MTDDSTIDPELAELLSSMLDGEIDADDRARAEALLGSSASARELFEALTAARDGVRELSAEGLEAAPTELERARIDRGVLGATEGRRARKKRKSPLPYFAVAAVIAVAVIAGLAVLTRSLTSPDSGQVAGTTSATSEDGAAGSAGETSTATGEAQGGEAPRATPEADAAFSGSGLYLSDLEASSGSDLDPLLASVSASDTRPGSVDLIAAAAGLSGLDDLPACLSAAGSVVVPLRVDTGTWQGGDVFFVTGPGPDGVNRVVVLARPTCGVAYVHS